MAKADDSELLEVAGRTVRISSPSKPYFTRGVQLTKLDIVKYFLSVAPGALRGIVGSSHRSEALCEWSGGGAVLSEARPQRSARVDADGDTVVPFRAHGGRSCGG